MSNVTTRYIVYNHNGTGIRHHHFGSENNIINVASGTASRGERIPALGFAHLEFNGQLVPFAFMSIVGNADDNHLYTEPGNREVIAGSSDITILVVYAPPAGIGVDDGPGVWVDAFNVNTGQFSDSPVFMQVFTPPTPPDSSDSNSTNTANTDGEISIVSAKNMRADGMVDGISFLKWKKIVPVVAIAESRDVSLTEKETGEIWFAFYHAQTFKDVTVPPSVPYGNMIEIAEGVWINLGRWVIGGTVNPPPPVDILPTLPAKLLTTLVILSLSSNMSEKVKAEAIKLAANHLNSIAESFKEMEIE